MALFICYPAMSFRYYSYLTFHLFPLFVFLFLFFSHSVPKFGVAVLSGLTLVSVLIKTCLSIKYGGGGLSVGFITIDNELIDYMDNVYYRPYTRISPYLVGMTLGFVMARRPHIRMRPVSFILYFIL